MGDTAWIVPEDYQQQGIPLFNRFLHGAHETYAWLLYEVDRKYGKAMIGRAIDQAVQSPWVRMGDMDQMMASLGTLTGDTALARRIAVGYPNPLSYSLVNDLRWQDFGFRPVLNDMSIEDQFVVDWVQPGGQADSAGFKPGDIIVKIDGFDLDTQRGDCWRGFMLKKNGDPVVLTVNRSGKLEDLTLAVKKRG